LTRQPKTLVGEQEVRFFYLDELSYDNRVRSATISTVGRHLATTAPATERARSPPAETRTRKISDEIPREYEHAKQTRRKLSHTKNDRNLRRRDLYREHFAVIA